MMVYANILLTVTALATFAFVVWPNWGGETVTNWVVGVAAVLTIVVAWTMVKCKCTPKEAPKEAPAEKAEEPAEKEEPAEEPKEEPKEEPEEEKEEK